MTPGREMLKPPPQYPHGGAMHPRTIRLHLALIKLAKGAIKAWEDWVLSHPPENA